MWSGQKLYETFFYLQFNLTMTSMPIMAYAIFDFEYFKDYKSEVLQTGGKEYKKTDQSLEI